MQGVDSGELVIEGVARDITKRHQAELQGRHLLAGIDPETLTRKAAKVLRLDSSQQ